MEYFALALVVVVALVIWKAISDSNEAEKLKKLLDQQFPNSHIHVHPDALSYVVLSPDTNLITIGLGKARGGLLGFEPPYASAYPISSIRKVEIVKDGSTVATTNRGSQALGAAVGGLALGGVGAIIGGLSASSTSAERIRSVTLTITVEDNERPVHHVTFLSWADKKGLKPDNFMVQQAFKEIEAVAARIENAMRKAEASFEKPEINQAPKGDTVSVIRELWSLKEAGAISLAEFETEKRRLLGSSATAN